MVKKTVVIEIDLSNKANDKLEHIAHARDYTVEQYLAEVVHSKLQDMIDHPVTVSFKVIKTKET